MKTMTIEEWEAKWVPQGVEAFDIRNRMLDRAEWDPEIGKFIGKQAAAIKMQDKPGYTAWDMAFANAVRGAGRFFLPFTQPESFEAAKDASDIGKKSTIPYRVEGFDGLDVESVTRHIKKLAVYFGADLVGVCRLDKRWLYSHNYVHMKGGSGWLSYPDAVVGDSMPMDMPDEYKYAISIAVNQDYDLVKYASTLINYTSNLFAYTRLTDTGNFLAGFIQCLGFKAVALPTHQVARHIPIAMQAGVGDAGRTGLLITPEFGPRVKVTTVVTDLPLLPDSPIDLGTMEFCAKCKKCAEVCPAQALSYGDRTTQPNSICNGAGELRWRVNAEKCAKYWTSGHAGCNVCVACCPYNKMKESFDYSDNLDPSKFWDDWRPRPYGAMVRP